MSKDVRFRWRWWGMIGGLYLITGLIGGGESLGVLTVLYATQLGLGFLDYLARRRRLDLYTHTVTQWRRLVNLGRALPDREWVTFDNVVLSHDRSVEARNFLIPYRYTQFAVFDSEDDIDSPHRSVIHRGYRVIWDDPLICTSIGGYAVDKSSGDVIHLDRPSWWASFRSDFGKPARISRMTGPTAAELNDLLDWFEHADIRQTARGGPHD